MSTVTASQPPTRVLLPHQIDVGASQLGQVLHGMDGRTMGTTWSIRLVGPRDLRLAVIERGVQAVLDRVIAQMSTWDEASDLCRFNRAEPNSWHNLPAEFDQVLRAALQVAHSSGGAYDPTAGALVNAWGFGPGQGHTTAGFAPPTPAQLASLPMGWQQLIRNPQGALLQPGGLQLDFSAIAKGFAVDAVAQYLDKCGLTHHLVEIGGELRGSGVKPNSQPWWVVLEQADAICPLPNSRLALHGLSVATSGDYRRCYFLDSARMSHTIDPRTRAPVAHGMASVTVIHSTCMWADAWSTALMVLGPQEGLALAEAHHLAALLQWRDAKGHWAEATSSAFRLFME